MKKSIAFGIIFLLISVSVIPSTGMVVEKQNIKQISNNGNILYVGGDGPGNYTKIQDAIDNASDGDTVYVYDDSSPYYENNIVVDKSINIIGEDKTSTVIDANDSYESVIRIDADWVNISEFTIQNGDDGIAIYSNYNSIGGNLIQDNYAGISLWYSNDNKIIGNNISNNRAGLSLYYSNGNILMNNSFFNDGLYVRNSSLNSIMDNTVNGKSLVYLEDESDTIIDADAGQIILINCNNITIQNQKLTNTTVGIELYNTNNCRIHDNIISSNNWNGIYLYSSSCNNTIMGNTIIDNSNGIYQLSSCNNNIIKENIINSNHCRGVYLSGFGNNITSNTINSNHHYGIVIGGSNNNICSNKISDYLYYGIDSDYTNNNNIRNNFITGRDTSLRDFGINLYKSCNYTIEGNIITNVMRGINLRYYSNDNIIKDNKFIFYGWYGIKICESCKNNRIRNNTITNGGCGINLSDSCCNNIIYHNNLIENHLNAEDSSNNTWDNGYPSGGNYWDDYNGTDADGDGIGDTPYLIPGGDNEDRYPLMESTYENQQPNAPKIDGPKSGKVGVEYEYNFSLFDEDGDLMFLRISWGSGTPGPWNGPYDSGDIVKLKHTWDKKGTYTIKAQSIDVYGAESDWSYLDVTMPKNKNLLQSPFWYRVLERFPKIQKMFLYLIE